MEKPPYKIPSMAQVKATKPNGFNVVSTFSGCGGSSLGYRMAGYRVLWANEFIRSARVTYEQNHDAIVDHRDIRTIRTEEIREAIDGQEIDLLDGSPPCASFSIAVADIREKFWGKVKRYSETKQRVDDLFDEYIRLVRGLRPKVFVAENVKGLTQGRARLYFSHVMRGLREAGYNVRCRLVDAQWLGVPQRRVRTIIVGVRSDLGLDPVHPRPLPYFYTVRDALRGSDSQFDGFKCWCDGYAVGDAWRSIGPECGWHPTRQSLYRLMLDEVCPTIQQRMANPNGKPFMSNAIMHNTECRYLTIPELKRLSSFPDDFKLAGSFAQQWERIGRAVPPRMMCAIAATIRDEVLNRVKG